METVLEVAKTYVVKFPAKSIAPPTNDNAGKLMASRAELLAIWSAPPID